MRAKVVTACSISVVSGRLMGITSTPSEAAAVWIAPHWPIPAVMAESRMIAARVMGGAISFSSSNPFAADSELKREKPGRVAAGPRQAINEPTADPFGNDHEYNRHGSGCLQQRSQSG